MTYNEMLESLGTTRLSVQLMDECRVNINGLPHEKQVMALAFYNEMAGLVERVSRYEGLDDWGLHTVIHLRNQETIKTCEFYPEVKPVYHGDYSQWDMLIHCDHRDIQEVYMVIDFKDPKDQVPIWKTIKVSDIVKLELDYE